MSINNLIRTILRTALEPSASGQVGVASVICVKFKDADESMNHLKAIVIATCLDNFMSQIAL